MKLKTDNQAKDLRDAFFDELYILAKRNKNLIILTNDMDAFSLQKFKKKFPKQFINMGVAEQNLINFSAGLSSTGKKVYVFGIASFVSFRCYEQIKFNICSRNLNVTIIGMGAGLSFSHDGPTHHSVQDLYAMHLIPEMNVFNPSDANSTAACAHLTYQSKYPTYVRIDKGLTKKIYNYGFNFSRGYKIIQKICKSTVISTGVLSSKISEIVNNFNKSNTRIGYIDIFEISKIENVLKVLINKNVKKILIIEENSKSAGILPIFTNLLSHYNYYLKIENISLPDKQFFDYGEREWILNKYGLSKEKIKLKLSKLNA